MPLYDFCCEKCGNIFEKVCSVNYPPPPCPNCGGKTHRLLSAVSFKIKGNEAVRRIEKRLQYYIKGGKYKDAARFLNKATEFVKDDKIKRLQEKVENKIAKKKKSHGT